MNAVNERERKRRVRLFIHHLADMEEDVHIFSCSFTCLFTIKVNMNTVHEHAGPRAASRAREVERVCLAFVSRDRVLRNTEGGRAQTLAAQTSDPGLPKVFFGGRQRRRG